jgi:hypothetical protein
VLVGDEFHHIDCGISVRLTAAAQRGRAATESEYLAQSRKGRQRKPIQESENNLSPLRAWRLGGRTFEVHVYRDAWIGRRKNLRQPRKPSTMVIPRARIKMNWIKADSQLCELSVSAMNTFLRSSPQNQKSCLKR